MRTGKRLFVLEVVVVFFILKLVFPVVIVTIIVFEIFFVVQVVELVIQIIVVEFGVWLIGRMRAGGDYAGCESPRFRVENGWHDTPPQKVNGVGTVVVQGVFSTR